MRYAHWQHEPCELQLRGNGLVQDVVQELQIQASIQEARTAAAAEAAAASEKRERSHTQVSTHA